MNDVKFGSWAVAESPITIEYSMLAIEEIRREVSDGFQKLSRGGIEVGGVLYGTREGREIRILAIRPISCEHARGPSFQLSDNDRASLEQQLSQDRADPNLEGMACLGWYLSHTRTDIMLGESDLEIFSTYFPDPWQVTLVVRPGRGGSMRAGFFIREADGTVKYEGSYLEFNFPDRLAAVFDRSSRAERPAPDPRGDPRGDARGDPRGGFGHSGSGAAAAAPAPIPVRDFAPLHVESVAEKQAAPAAVQIQPEPGRKWVWLLVWLLAVALIAEVGGRYYFTQTVTEPIGLSILEREGQLQIQWDVTAKPVKNAVRGSLDIVDGPQVKNITLTPQNLAGGRFTYQRVGGDVRVQMIVEGSDGTKSAPVASQFLGPPPVQPVNNDAELAALETRRHALEAEIGRLRGENDAQSARIQQLERTLRILQTRLGEK